MVRHGQSGTEGTDRDKKGQTMTNGNRQGQTETKRDCPCLSLTKAEIKKEEQRKNMNKTTTKENKSAEKNRDQPSWDTAETIRNNQLLLFSLLCP